MRSTHMECRLISRKFVCNALLLTVLTVGLSAEVSPSVSDLPSNQQVLGLLTESIDWYRHRAIEGQIATGPVDLVFLNDNRPTAAQIVQLSFDFARADASLAAMSEVGKPRQGVAIASGSSPELARFVQLQKTSEVASRQTSQEIEDIKKKLLTAHGAERRRLQAALDVNQSRLDLLQAGLARLRELIQFVQVSGGRETGDLESSIEDLARALPGVSNPSFVGSQTRNSDVVAITRPRDSGILGLSSELSALGRKLHILDDEIGRTDRLRQSSNHLRTPLLAYVNKRLPTAADNYLQGSDLHLLERQKAELDALTAVAEALAPAMVALDKQNVLLAAYSSHLKIGVPPSSAKTRRHGKV